MTKVMLIAGVAALAIAAPAAAGPHGHGGGHGGGRPEQARGGGGGGFRMQAAPRMQRAPQRTNFAQRAPARRPQVQRAPARMAAQRQALQRDRAQQRQAMQRERSNVRQARAVQQRNVQRQAMRQDQMHQLQARALQQHANQRQAMVQRQQQLRADHAQARNQMLADRALNRRQVAENRIQQAQMQRQRAAQVAHLPQRQLAANFAPRYANARAGLAYGCPPGLAARNNGCLPPGQAMKLVGAPIARAASLTRLAALPQPLRYLYPDSPDRYYRYGDGYLYQVDRSNDVIDSMLPLVAGGYVPGMAFPASYMNSYVPDTYGMSSFYPDTPYADYRYLDGNVYSVDPYSGAIQDVIPTYAYGYGVGQMLPAGYGYYNVPAQYRSVYYNTPESNYWYSPGAIYQVDPGSQLITGVASLLAPGLSVGQPLPAGYGVYNVPMAYRSTYYDTPNAWYRYNNGYIYQVDPTTQLVTAVVASLLA